MKTVFSKGNVHSSRVTAYSFGLPSLCFFVWRFNSLDMADEPKNWGDSHRVLEW